MRWACCVRMRCTGCACMGRTASTASAQGLQGQSLAQQGSKYTPLSSGRSLRYLCISIHCQSFILRSGMGCACIGRQHSIWTGPVGTVTRTAGQQVHTVVSWAITRVSKSLPGPSAMILHNSSWYWQAFSVPLRLNIWQEYSALAICCSFQSWHMLSYSMSQHDCDTCCFALADVHCS